MSKNDWTNDLRNHLAEYQVPVEEDVLWASIQQKLALEQQSSLASQQLQKARIVSIRRWSAAAAACAILGIGGTYLFLHSSADDVLTPRVGAGSIAHTHKSKDPAATAQDAFRQMASASEKSGLQISESKADAPLRWVKNVLMGGESASETEEMLAVASVEETPSLETATMVQQQTETSSSSVSVASTPHAKRQLGANTSTTVRSRSHVSHTPSWNMKLYGENGLVLQNNLNDESMGYMSSAADPMPSYPINDAVTQYASLLAKAPKPVEEKHHRPVTLGLQVGFELLPRLTLTTGVVYTRVASEFKAENVERKQTLHYVGVPLGVNYEVWGTKRFHTYMSVGGEGDVNVANHTELNGGEIDGEKDRMQWSANAAVGVQLDVAPQIGIYAEPGMKYYFDNGSVVKNSFKDKKLNFNFQLGLRWNLGKK